MAGLVPSPDAAPWASGGWTGLRTAGQGRGRGIGWGTAQKGGPGGGAWGGTWPQESEALARLTWSRGRLPPSPAVCGGEPLNFPEPLCSTARWGGSGLARHGRGEGRSPQGREGAGGGRAPSGDGRDRCACVGVRRRVQPLHGAGRERRRHCGLVLGPKGPNSAFVSV